MDTVRQATRRVQIADEKVRSEGTVVLGWYALLCRKLPLLGQRAWMPCRWDLMRYPLSETSHSLSTVGRAATHQYS